MNNNGEVELCFADVAGLHDAHGDSIELINSFMMKKIFAVADKVRFLIPIEYSAFGDARGKSVRDSVEFLLKVFKGSLRNICNSIQPILTKVRPKEDGFDIDCAKDSMK